MEGIEIKNVSKSYGGVKALEDVSVNFGQDKIYGFLGRNGAGKTTLINILANRIFADQGSVTIDGDTAVENMAVHDKLYCMSEADLYDTGLRIKDIFKWTGRFYGGFHMDTAMEIADKFKLDVNKKFKTLSKGYQSIFKLTVALALRLPYVVFDEPVLGLDANHRELFYELLLREYANYPRTIIIATHLIEEVSGLIEEVVLIDNGRVILQETVEELTGGSYCVSGLASEVDEFCRGRKVIDTDELGALKQAYIMGTRPEIPKDSRLQISAVNLQKLFIKLTERGGK